MVFHACNLNTQSLGWEECNFKATSSYMVSASLNHTMRPSIKMNTIHTAPIFIMQKSLPRVNDAN